MHLTFDAYFSEIENKYCEIFYKKYFNFKFDVEPTQKDIISKRYFARGGSEILICVGGEVIVDDCDHVLDVHASTEDVGGPQDWNFQVLEARDALVHVHA